MERKLASIQVIKNLEPIQGADAIEKATILGWSLVVKKGEFQVGGLCCYCEVDSILPERPEFEFLRPRHFRIKTVKLRGQVSQGIAFPVTILPPMDDVLSEHGISAPAYEEGDDVTEILGVTKYEPYIPAQLAGQVKGNFPGFLHKTDETRIQTVPEVLVRHHNKKFYITEKLDGSSMTVYLNNGEFGVCSRNLDIRETEDNSFWKVARSLDLENKLKGLERSMSDPIGQIVNISLQGELVGNGVQKNKYGMSGLDYFLFNVFDIDKQEYVPYETFVEIAKRLALKTVPVVGLNYTLPTTVDELVFYSKGKSVLNPTVHREGIVLRPLVEDTDEELGRLSFKCINPDFLLKYDD